MVSLHFLFPISKVIPFPWNLLGVIPFILGFAASIISDSAFKKYKTTVRPFEVSTVLITCGIYRITRNPMYLGFVLILIGISIFMGSLTPYVVIPIFTILIHVVFVRAEERILQDTFGESWLKYKKSTRRWI